MLKRLAKCSALPGVGEATATSSASWGIIWSEVAWMSAWNWEPMMPIFTLSLLAIGGPSLWESEKKNGRTKTNRSCRDGAQHAAPLHDRDHANYLGVGSSQPMNSWL